MRKKKAIVLTQRQVEARRGLPSPRGTKGIFGTVLGMLPKALAGMAAVEVSIEQLQSEVRPLT